MEEIINSFKSDQWDKIILTIPISQSFSNLTEVMTSIEQTLQKLNTLVFFLINLIIFFDFMYCLNIKCIK